MCYNGCREICRDFTLILYVAEDIKIYSRKNKKGT